MTAFDLEMKIQIDVKMCSYPTTNCFQIIIPSLHSHTLMNIYREKNTSHVLKQRLSCCIFLVITLSSEDESSVGVEEPLQPSSSKRSVDRIVDMWSLPYPFNSQVHKAKTKAVALYLLEEGLPMYSVERPGFKKMLRTFDRR